ncbi:HAD family hydrolase [Corynebacterium lowii]|uniref:Phosphonoacetaldehyde hydrolase n=1 Tax=Corynebacterium lowii TaxID=1544413 RepID=A0A0Q1E2Q8_9CORY|nr:HAD family hydrolase [Corynebacterium lowii]KQB86881.1 Phosphonoacetaldehyde hydrolase [Corynebacterium lowii]MDP9851569.1 phosphonatase-like hydrolase [Corynebacterium lowii]
MPLIVCDIAGTTIDEHNIVYQELRACVEKRGVAVKPTDLNAVKGTEKRSAISTLLFPQGNPDMAEVDSAFADFLAGLRCAYTEHPPLPLPGTQAALENLRERGYRLALTTGFQRDIAQTVLEACGWGVRRATSPSGRVDTIEGGFLLDALVTSDCVAAGRPAPYLIHRAMEMTATASVHEVVAVGDTVADLRAAANAGVRGVGVLTGSVPREVLEAEPHAAVLESLAEVPAFLP